MHHPAAKLRPALVRRYFPTSIGQCCRHHHCNGGLTEPCFPCACTRRQCGGEGGEGGTKEFDVVLDPQLTLSSSCAFISHSHFINRAALVSSNLSSNFQLNPTPPPPPTGAEFGSDFPSTLLALPTADWLDMYDSPQEVGSVLPGERVVRVSTRESAFNSTPRKQNLHPCWSPTRLAQILSNPAGTPQYWLISFQNQPTLISNCSRTSKRGVETTWLSPLPSPLLPAPNLFHRTTHAWQHNITFLGFLGVSTVSRKLCRVMKQSRSSFFPVCYCNLGLWRQFLATFF